MKLVVSVKSAKGEERRVLPGGMMIRPQSAVRMTGLEYTTYLPKNQAEGFQSR